MGKLLVIGGLIMAGLGLLIMTGVPVGRLPGDFSFKRGNFTFYFRSRHPSSRASCSRCS